MHCYMTFYGPQVPPNTGILAIQRLSGLVTGFLIVGTGIALDFDKSFEIFKKLKLVGSPRKVFKNTAFISEMFNSDFEVNRFEGASIRTVSGIRGQVKKALQKGQPGDFRATFEDKIMLSDIVFCRTWIRVNIKKYYNPVTTLSEKDASSHWRGMKSKAQLQVETQTPILVNVDSIYKTVERPVQKLIKFCMPKSIEAALPYASKPKNSRKRRKKSYISNRAVVMSSCEKKKYSFMQAVNTIRNEKISKRNERKRREKEDKIRKK